MYVSQLFVTEVITPIPPIAELFCQFGWTPARRAQTPPAVVTPSCKAPVHKNKVLVGATPARERLVDKMGVGAGVLVGTNMLSQVGEIRIPVGPLTGAVGVVGPNTDAGMFLIGMVGYWRNGQLDVQVGGRLGDVLHLLTVVLRSPRLPARAPAE